MASTGMVSGISVHAKTCSGCRMCEQVCVFFHYREFNPRRSRIKVQILEKEGVNAPLLCSQCKTCISSCNRDALSWDDKVGVVRVDAEKCNGCGICIDVCEENAIFMDPITGIVNICDLCDGDPECIKWCPEDVLRPINGEETDVETEKAA